MLEGFRDFLGCTGESDIFPVFVHAPVSCGHRPRLLPTCVHYFRLLVRVALSRVFVQILLGYMRAAGVSEFVQFESDQRQIEEGRG